MPKVVDKDARRKEISCLCKDLFIEKGFSKLTVSEVAKSANIGKGSVYQYFDSKEDIVYEIIKNIQQEFDLEVEKKINNASTTRERVLSLFELWVSKDPQIAQVRRIYKEFLTLCLDKNSDERSCFRVDTKDKHINILKAIFQDGIANNELIPSALEFVDGLYIMAEGQLILSNYGKRGYSEDVLTNHIHSLFNILEKQ